MERIVCVLIGYVFGLIQTGYLYGKTQHVDIRKQGSGNAGTTNALRTLGWKAGAVTFLGDCFKCVAAVVLVYFLFGRTDPEMFPVYAMYAGMGAVMGHNYPFYMNFKGGKGIGGNGRTDCQHNKRVDCIDLPVRIFRNCGRHTLRFTGISGCGYCLFSLCCCIRTDGGIWRYRRPFI